MQKCKKEICNKEKYNQSTQRQLYLKKLESNYSNVNYSMSNITKNHSNNISEMDKKNLKSYNEVDGAIIISVTNDIIKKKKKRKRKKKKSIVSDVTCQDNGMLKESDSSLEEGEIIDLNEEKVSKTPSLEDISCSKTKQSVIENSSLAKISKGRIFDDVNVSETECEKTQINDTANVCKNASLEAMKNILDKEISNSKKQIKSSNKLLLDDTRRKKLEEIMKRAVENKDEDKKMIKLKRKALSRENHENELQPKETKKEFKSGDKVLVSSFNGELIGPFVIVELVGSYSCKLRSLNAVNCGENGLFSDESEENEEKLLTEYITNLIHFQNKPKKLTSINKSHSNELLKSENKSDSIFPERKNTPNIKQYSNRNSKRIKINIDLKKDTNIFQKKKSNVVVDWVKSLKLNSSHKEILLDEECCLTTDIIDTANQLIRKKWPFVDGLRTPFQVQCPTGFPAMKGGGVQILFDEEREHWFTASNMRDGSVEVADSMVPDALTYSAKKQIVQCFRDHEENGVLKVNMLPVCQQDNEVDCGLYAIANAVEFICENGDPLSRYIRSDLREQLIKCFEQDEILQFSKATLGSTKRAVNQPKHSKVEVILTNSILDRCNRQEKRETSKPPSDEMIVELSSDSE